MIPTYQQKHNPSSMNSPPPPPLANPAVLARDGFANVADFNVSAVSPLVAHWLTASTSDQYGRPTIDVSQAQVFLDHMIHRMGLYTEDLVYMRIFVERYQTAVAAASRSSGTPTQGLQLLFAAYLAQSLQYDEPLSKSVWTYYSKMSWGDFLTALFEFSGTFGMDLSVTAEQWNGAAWALLSPLVDHVEAEPRVGSELLLTTPPVPTGPVSSAPIASSVFSHNALASGQLVDTGSGSMKSKMGGMESGSGIGSGDVSGAGVHHVPGWS